MASDRFKELKEMDEESKKEVEEESVDVEVPESGTGSTGSSGTTGSTGTTDTTENKDSKSGGNVKDRNPRMAMFPPKEHKNGFDEALRKVKAVCSLADKPEPKKLSEFSGAVLKHGYDDLEGICRELELDEAYEEYGGVVQK